MLGYCQRKIPTFFFTELNQNNADYIVDVSHLAIKVARTYEEMCDSSAAFFFDLLDQDEKYRDHFKCVIGINSLFLRHTPHTLYRNYLVWETSKIDDTIEKFKKIVTIQDIDGQEILENMFQKEILESENVAIATLGVVELARIKGQVLSAVLKEFKKKLYHPTTVMNIIRGISDTNPVPTKISDEIYCEMAKLIDEINTLVAINKELHDSNLKQSEQHKCEIETLKTKVWQLEYENEVLNIKTAMIDEILNNSDNNKDFQCTICCDTFVSPVVTERGSTYCDSCISSWFKEHNTDPMTNITVTSKILIPNIELRKHMVRQKINPGPLNAKKEVHHFETSRSPVSTRSIIDRLMPVFRQSTIPANNRTTNTISDEIIGMIDGDPFRTRNVRSGTDTSTNNTNNSDQHHIDPTTERNLVDNWMNVMEDLDRIIAEEPVFDGRTGEFTNQQIRISPAFQSRLNDQLMRISTNRRNIQPEGPNTIDFSSLYPDIDNVNSDDDELPDLAENEDITRIEEVD